MPVFCSSSANGSVRSYTSSTSSASSVSSAPMPRARSQEWISASVVISQQYSAAGISPRDNNTVPSSAPPAPNAAVDVRQRRIPRRDRIRAELIAVEAVADVGHGRTIDERGHPQLLDGHVVHQRAHVPVGAGRRVVPLPVAGSRAHASPNPDAARWNNAKRSVMGARSFSGHCAGFIRSRVAAICW